MFSIRRYFVYVISAAAFLLILHRLSRDELSPIIESPASPIIVQGSSDLRAQNLPKFRWDKVPIHYPIAPASLIPLPTEAPRKLPKLQFEFLEETPDHAATRKSRQAAVKNAFTRGWDAYREHAWMHDELGPITAKANDKFGGWGATLVDNLDTLWIMDLKVEFHEAVTAVLKIDTSNIKIETINVFETNIRHLGGLLSAYDLSGDRALLDKAREFGDMLIKAFDTPNHLPITRWDWAAAAQGVRQEGPEKILLAEIGSLSMEFTRLSQLTGDSKWFSAVHNISRIFEENLSKSLLPGMFPVTLHARSSLDVSQDNWFTLNGMADSYYEYLPKMHLLLGGTEPVYEKLYVASMETALKHTIYRPMTPDNADILFSGAIRVKETGNELYPLQQHLGCFTGGMLTIGGQLFKKPSYFTAGEKLTKGCVWSYQALPLGVMTEEFTVSPCADTFKCEWDVVQWHADVLERMTEHGDVERHIRESRLMTGFTSYQDTKYHLRPEAIESVFLLYRQTGDQSLQDTAWSMFQSIMNLTTTEYANAALLDVSLSQQELARTGLQNNQFDSMESFWMAETLKYFYLIFSESELISLDEYVFNTEAHPFRIPRT